MTITILKDSLKDALSVVERASSKNPSLPILGCISLVAEKNKVVLSATDLEMGIVYSVLAKTEKEGGVAVPSRLLSQFVGFLQEPQISLEISAQGLEISSKTRKTVMKTFPAEDFPVIPSIGENDECIDVDTKTLCIGLGQVSPMAGQTSSRPEISGVFFSFQGDTLRLVATDSFRLAEKVVPLTKHQEKELSFILPTKTARELLGILQDQTGKTKIYISPSQVLFEFAVGGGQEVVKIVSRLIEGEYPRYQDVIPQDCKTKVVVDKQELISQLRSSSVFSGKLNDVHVSVDIAKRGIALETKSQESGEYSSFLAGDAKGNPLEISFNWKFFLDGASQFKAKDIEIGFSGEEAPAVLRAVGTSEGYVYVVMPVRA